MKQLALKIFTLLLALNLSSICVFGQKSSYRKQKTAPDQSAKVVSKKEPIEVGLKGGIDFSWLSGGDVKDWDSKVGFCGGFFLHWRVSKIFGIQPELLYAMKGAKHTEEWEGKDLKVTLSIDYLEIPVLAKATIPTSVKLRPNIFAGPYLGIKLRGKQKAESSGSSIEEDIKDLKSTDFGLVLGGGAEYDIGQGKVTFEVRYSLGLTKIFSGGEVKNSMLVLMLGYIF